MPSVPIFDADRLVREARAVLDALPPDTLPLPVYDWILRFGLDSTGDEAFFIRAVLDLDDAGYEAIPPGAFSQVSRTVLTAIRSANLRPDVWTYVTYPSRAEMEAMDRTAA